MSKEAKLVSSIIAVVVIILGAGIFLMIRTPANYANPGTAIDPKTKEEALSRTTPHTRGKQDSSVVVTEFADLQCPACARVNPLLDELAKTYGDKVKFVFRHNPLTQHKNALTAADAAEAAGEQGKFFEMVALLYDKQSAWETLADPRPLFQDFAKELGLDKDKFEKALLGQIFRDRIVQDRADGEKLENPGTPTFYVGDKQIFNGGLDEVKKLIEEALNPSSPESAK